MNKKPDATEEEVPATDTPVEEVPAKTEEQDHADNGAAATAPVPVEPRRDGNGALIV